MNLAFYSIEDTDEGFLLHPVDHANLDGYHFGDRLLEGVKFKIVAHGKTVTATPATKFEEDYLRKLNAKKWLKGALNMPSNVIYSKVLILNKK